MKLAQTNSRSFSMYNRFTPRPFLLLTTCAIVIAGASALAEEDNTVQKIPLTFSGGHETDKKDGGRPVVLIAAALEVTPEVFRQAFSGVTPAKGGKPSPAQARSNKAALLKVLGPHGVTNERLDEVSDYYRYQPQRGEIWKSTPAQAHALVKDGRIQEIILTNPGAGYTTPPTATLRTDVPGFEKIELKLTLHFSKDLKKNGSIKSIEVAKPKE